VILFETLLSLLLGLLVGFALYKWLKLCYDDYLESWRREQFYKYHETVLYEEDGNVVVWTGTLSVTGTWPAVGPEAFEKGRLVDTVVGDQ